MRSHGRMTIVTMLALAAAIAAASCAGDRPEIKGDNGGMDHEMHGMPETEHAGHEAGQAATDGSWSYMGRENPEPIRDNRWEMIPVPGYGHMYLTTGGLDRGLLCDALRDNPAIMSDRATRRACGMPETPPTAGFGKAATKPRIEHEHHEGMVMPHEMPHKMNHEMPHEAHGTMEAHWMAPEEAAKRPNPVPADTASIERGGNLYQAHCTVCHGAEGRGDGPAAVGLTPKPANLAVMSGQHPPGDLFWKIGNGRGAMPAWKGILSETQIWEIVNFLRSLKKTETRPGTEPEHHDAPGHAH